MKPFTKAHICFAAFFVVAIIVAIQLPPLVRELRASPDAARYWFWILILESLYFVLTYGATISWLLFAIYHLFVMIRQHFQQKDEH
jgi:hypothetical protein